MLENVASFIVFELIKQSIIHLVEGHSDCSAVFLSSSLQDRQLKVKDMVLSTHERAVRNCPWTMGLWKSYLLALERHGADHHTVSGNRDVVCDKHHRYGGKKDAKPRVLNRSL